MPWTTADIPSQIGHTALITGANGGLGLRTAEALAAAGAEVIMACRNQAKAELALLSVASLATSAPPRIVTLDLADLGSVRRCADEVVGSVDKIDILVNNAGVMAIPDLRTADGFEMQFGTNHLGHFALTGLLLPALQRAPQPRVVTVSSIAHWGGTMRWTDLQWERRYSRSRAYAQSKLANLLFTSELATRAARAGSRLVAAAAHPGFSDTNLQTVAPAMSGSRLAVQLAALGNRVFAQPDTMGALPSLRAATDPDVRPNDYFGASGPLPGPLEVRGYPKRVPRSPLANRSADAARLWERSEELTDVQYAWAAAPTRAGSRRRS
jgi:NAD(P)-dependent dehydrogenase (short-subunit alcohol dehydrogenase family)